MNMLLKKSRQRDTILECVQTHDDHPTADTIYHEVRKIIPNISLGTIYRNLSLLVHIGKIRKLSINDSADRFDCNLIPHSHFICTDCGKILDIPKDLEPELNLDALASFHGTIDEHTITFFGHCADCTSKKT